MDGFFYACSHVFFVTLLGVYAYFKRRMKKIIYIFLTLLPFFAKGQDIHFTQFTRTEFLINPAFTGAFGGNFRATMNWKDQWRSINNTYRTFASAAEFAFAKGRSNHPTYYAVGLFAAKDVAGDVEFGTTSIGLSFASLFQLSQNQRLSAGVQGGYTKNGVNTSTMQWGSQYVGNNFDPSLYDGEGIEYLPQQFWDLSAGVAYWFHKGDNQGAYGAPQDAKIGLAVYHLNRPENSFIIGKKSIVPIRAVFHASALFPTPLQDLYWFPNVTAQFQGAQHQLFFGAIAKYNVVTGSKMTGNGTEMALSVGLNFRINNVFDAIIPQVYFDFQGLSLGLSYDINMSRLNTASSYRGGFEMSIRFTNPDGYIHKNPYRRAITI